MLKLIDAEEKYLTGYKEAYILSLQELEKGTIKKRNLSFDNPDEIDIIQKFKRIIKGLFNAFNSFTTLSSDEI